MQDVGLPTNERSKSHIPQNKQQQKVDQKSVTQSLTKSLSPKKFTHSKSLSNPNTSYQNISKKQTLTTDIKPNTKAKDNKPKQKMSNLIFTPMNSLVQNIREPFNKERELNNQIQISSIPEEPQSQFEDYNEYTNNPIRDSSLAIRETLSKIDQKLASAQRKIESKSSIINKAQQKVKVASFDNQLSEGQKQRNQRSGQRSDISGALQSDTSKFESTAPMTNKMSIEPMQTPYQETSKFNLGDCSDNAIFNSDISVKTSNTDEFGNRQSILPAQARPKVAASKRKSSTKKKDSNLSLEDDNMNILDKLKEQNKALKESRAIKKNPQAERQNFVRLNMKQNYKPRSRGAQYTNKIMAKKKNQLKFRDKFKKKMQIEAAMNRDQVNIYGGLGKVGLDHEGGKHEEQEGDEEQVPTFSASALKFVQKPKVVNEADDLIENSEEQEENDLKQIDELVNEDEADIEVEDIDQDKQNYQIPSTDEGYRIILKERFGFDNFLEGQLEAIKILLEKKENVMVVLATGGGKSLTYQYASQFLPGLVIIVTPLIALMTDQLRKLPDFITGACVNSQQPYAAKKQIMKAIQDKHIKVLFISPERFFIEDFSKFQRKISMVCVDEIHCASEWSHNFRPTYLKLNDMIKNKIGNDAVVVGLTATATKATQKQICKVFDIPYPQNIVTQPDLSRLNLHLSITRDNEKEKALLGLLRSEGYRRLTSILIYATQKRTCEQVASYLNIKVLVCTIAFSMGIDKSDIQSVIHYDMPRSIENYVQEIGRAGRDGKLARCHLFLNNDDFYQIRRITLTDLLDNQNALKLTSKIIVEAKRTLLSIVNPEFKASKKRKFKSMSGEEKAQIIEEFDHEQEINKYYTKDKTTKQIIVGNIDEFKNSEMYLFLNAKETSQLLDLKKEVILTMLHSLEKMEEGKAFFKLESMLPASMGIRFHKAKPQEMAKTDKFIRNYLELAVEKQGVYRCQMAKLAYHMNISPFEVPKILLNLQNQGDGQISYELDQESFVLKIQSIPSNGQTLELSELMLKETRRIEKNMISKINCMYFIARKVSLPTIEVLMKKEKTEDADLMYKGFTAQVNKLINKYFSITEEDDMEIQIAGSEEERNIMMPLQYIDSHRKKADVESEIKSILRDFHDTSQSAATIEPSERVKALDIVKILMGIYSERPNVKRHMYDSKIWAKLQDYDYEEIYKIASAIVSQYYFENATGGCDKKEENEDDDLEQAEKSKIKRRQIDN